MTPTQLRYITFLLNRLAGKWDDQIANRLDRIFAFKPCYWCGRGLALLLLGFVLPLAAQDTVRAVNHGDTLRLPYWAPGDPGGCFSVPLQGSTQRHVACWPASVTVVTRPGRVADLTVASTADSVLTLRFTEVSDGAGKPASYFVRIAKSPLAWGGIPDVSRGTCASPFAGTAIGATRTCTITGLTPATKYDAQLVAFRGVPNTTSTVFGALSNVATATTISTVAVFPPPSPPPVVGSHEPTGLTLIADYGFGDLLPVQADGVLGTSGWGIVNPQGYAVRALDLAPPTASAFVADFMYPVGFPEGSAPATMYKAGFSVGELYAGFWWKPSNPWQNETAGVNKIAFMVTTPGGAFIGDILAMVPGPTGPYLRLGNEINQPSSNYEPNVTKTPIVLGQWHFVEWWIKGSGGLRWWLDGVLQGDYPNYTVPNPFTMFQFSPTWGGFGAGDVKTEVDHYWFNHVRLSGGTGVTITPPIPPPSGFATPDLLNNASFETGWDGFHNLVGSTGDPASLGSSVGLTTITRSQDHAHAGTWSAKSGFSANPGSDEAINMQYDFGTRSHVFVRVWFYATATPTNAHKWIRFYDGNGTNAMGVENERSWAGAISWVFNNSTGCVNCGNLIGVGVATLNAWHSLEIDYDAGNGRVRFYYDGTLTMPIVNNPGSVTVDPVNGWLTSAGGPTASPRYLVFDDTYNAGNTASGAFYYDQVAVSTQRIGP